MPRLYMLSRLLRVSVVSFPRCRCACSFCRVGSPVSACGAEVAPACRRARIILVCARSMRGGAATRRRRRVVMCGRGRGAGYGARRGLSARGTMCARAASPGLVRFASRARPFRAAIESRGDGRRVGSTHRRSAGRERSARTRRPAGDAATVRWQRVRGRATVRAVSRVSYRRGWGACALVADVCRVWGRWGRRARGVRIQSRREAF